MTWTLTHRVVRPSGVFYCLASEDRALGLRHGELTDSWRCSAVECAGTFDCEHIHAAKAQITPDLLTYREPANADSWRAA